MSKEEFAVLLGAHFVREYAEIITGCQIKVVEDYWARLVNVTSTSASAEKGADGNGSGNAVTNGVGGGHSPTASFSSPRAGSSNSQ